MVLGLGPLHTAVFHVADVAITAGAVCLILSISSRQPDGLRLELYAPQPTEAFKSPA